MKPIFTFPPLRRRLNNLSTQNPKNLSKQTEPPHQLFLASGSNFGERQCSSGRTAARLRSAALGNREVAIGSAAIDGKPLGNCRYGWEGRTTTNDSRAG